MLRVTLLSLVVVSLLNAQRVDEYFPNGALKSQIHYKDGTRSETSPGIKEGLERVYYLEGGLAYEVNYRNDKRDGVMRWWDKQGNLIKVLHYDNGKLEGWEINYYPSGKLKSKQLYRDDKREGVYKEYFDNGNLALEVPYKHGKKEGIQREYYYDGSLQSEVLYKNNYKEGIRRWYDKEGKVVKEERFVHDRPVDILKQLRQKSAPKVDERLKGLNFSPNRPH